MSLEAEHKAAASVSTHLESEHGSEEASPSLRCLVIALWEAVKIRLIF